MARLNEKELAEKTSYLIKGMSSFKIHQILGVIKDVISEHLSEPGNSVILNRLFTANTTIVKKYDINSSQVIDFECVKYTTSETLKKKINERTRNKKEQLQSNSKKSAFKNKKHRS